MDTEEYRKKAEEEILKVIAEKLQDRKMDAPKAQAIAKLVLESLHPQMTLDQIHEAVDKFDDNFPELTSVVLQIDNDYQEKIKQIVSAHAVELIKNGKIGEASNLMQKTLNKQVKLGQ